MLFKLTIDMGNDAFTACDLDTGCELARLLRKLADDVEYTICNGAMYVLLDANGNNVGVATATGVNCGS